jgi:23S rRNA pseudouridine955/2504/2580 synthase
LFKTGRIKKIYIALVEGIISKAEVWVDWLARDSNTRRSLAAKQDRGREAVTEIIPVAAGNRTSCILCLPRTGRTHQIRAQAALHGHPLEGDKKYGSSGKAPFYVLHAAGVCIQEEYNSLRIPALSAELPGPAEDVFCRLFSRDILARVYTAVRTQLKKGVPGVHLTHK